MWIHTRYHHYYFPTLSPENLSLMLPA
jgi:hypothetical protein